MDEVAKNILKKNRINVTQARLAVLEIFLHAKNALTHNDLLDYPGHHLDRVTVFRALKLFTQKNILHLIPAPDGLNRYLFKTSSSFASINFICNSCKKITPLKINYRPRIDLPDGIKQKNIEIIITGLCESCSR